MGFQDRPYYRDRNSDQSPLMRILNASFPLFTAFGIRVRAHWTLLALIFFTMLSAGGPGGIGFRAAGTFSATLFAIVILHEFGHCFAARSVGGDADEIILWPLGGLAMTTAPMRWWPQFVTVAGGPLVNLAICILAVVGLVITSHGAPGVPWNPLSAQFFLPRNAPVSYALWFVFVVSWGLFLFNLWPVFPLDGGQLLRAILWSRLGHYRATLIAAAVGMGGAVVMAGVGLTHFGTWYGSTLLFLGVGCFLTCMQLRAATRAAGPEEYSDTVDYSAAYEINPRPARQRKSPSTRATKRLRARFAAERAERELVDQILAKVGQHGIASLTRKEKKILQMATEHSRRRDVEAAELE